MTENRQYELDIVNWIKSLIKIWFWYYYFCCANHFWSNCQSLSQPTIYDVTQLWGCLEVAKLSKTYPTVSAHVRKFEISSFEGIYLLWKGSNFHTLHLNRKWNIKMHKITLLPPPPPPSTQFGGLALFWHSAWRSK